MLDKDRLIALRNGQGLYQKDMAALLNIGRTTYVKYETGSIQPPNDTVSFLADYFNVTTDYLLGKADNPTPPQNEKAPISDEDLKFALWGKTDVTDKQLERLKEIARIIEDEDVT